jgi:hypothetical protein
MQTITGTAIGWMSLHNVIRTDLKHPLAMEPELSAKMEINKLGQITFSVDISPDQRKSD